jgi:hypothetical protein
VEIHWSIKKFGTERVLDICEAWVKLSHDIKKMEEAQVSGAAGRRVF